MKMLIAVFFLHAGTAAGEVALPETVQIVYLW